MVLSVANAHWASGQTIPMSSGPSVFSQPATPLRDSPTLNTLFGKPALVVLFQPNCGHCRVQMRNTVNFVKMNPHLQTFAVSEYGSRDALERALNLGGVDIPAYRSSPHLLNVLGKPRGAPRTFLLDSYGRVVLATKGTQNLRQLENFLESASQLRK